MEALDTFVQLLPLALWIAIVAFVIYFCVIINKYLKLKTRYYQYKLRKMEEENK